MWFETSNSWFSSFKLGASVEQLAKEMFEDLLGYEGEGGHKPPREDITKMKELADLQTEAQYADWAKGDVRSPEQLDSIAAAKARWRELTEMTPAEKEIHQSYVNADAANDWQGTIDWYEQQYPGLHEAFNRSDIAANGPGSWAETLKSAEKKAQTKIDAGRYGHIKTLLTELLTEAPSSYKIWPWAIKQIKNSAFGSATHFYDIVKEGGELLNQLRQEHRTPQGLDINQMTFREFDDWLMQWKKDNRESEAQGEIVYQFHDGWTIQRLTTPEQLQYEGDEVDHCVGGYSSEVASKKSHIYSLRDPKGGPHVTIEIEGRRLGKPEEQTSYLGDRHGPHDIDSTMSYLQTAGNQGGWKDWDKEFEVVQVMGKGNSTPKPEYQHKIFEFLNTLSKEKDIHFVRGENWTPPHDQDEDEESMYKIWNPKLHDPDEWWNAYSEYPDQFLGESFDEYGLSIPQTKTGFTHESSVIQGMDEVINGYDPYEVAKQIFHAVIIDGWTPDMIREKVETAFNRLKQYGGENNNDRYDPPVGFHLRPEDGLTNDDAVVDAKKYLNRLYELAAEMRERPFDIHPRISLPKSSDIQQNHKDAGNSEFLQIPGAFE